MHPAPLAPPAPRRAETSAPPRRVWRAGTLTYTVGGLAALFGWLLWGDFVWQLKERSVQPVVQVLLKMHAASDFLTGLLLGTLPAVIGMLVGPIICYRSDRHRGRWGRRIPFLLIPTPIVMLTVFLLAASPALGAQLHAWLGARSPGPNACVLLLFGASWTLFEVATIMANALVGALVNDVVPREMLGRFFGLFRACSLLAGIVFNRYLFGVADTHYVQIFVGVGLLYGVGFTLMCLKVKEGHYPPPPPPDPSRPPGFLSACRLYLRECYTNPYYLWIFVVLACATIAFAPINLFSVYYADSIGMSRQSYGNHLALTYAISLSIAFFLGWLADRFHPLRMGIFSLGLYAAVMAWGGFEAQDASRFGVAFVAHGVLSGMYFTTTASLMQRLFPLARFAQFASAAGIVGSLAGTVLPLLLGAALDVGNAGKRVGDYHQTFFWGAGLALVGLAGLLVIHAKWMRLGGKQAYVAPE